MENQYQVKVILKKVQARITRGISRIQLLTSFFKEVGLVTFTRHNILLFTICGMKINDTVTNIKITAQQNGPALSVLFIL